MMNKKLNKTEETVLAVVSKRQETVSSEIVNLIDLSPRSVQRALKKLAQLELIEAICTTRDRRY